MNYTYIHVPLASSKVALCTLKAIFFRPSGPWYMAYIADILASSAYITRMTITHTHTQTHRHTHTHTHKNTLTHTHTRKTHTYTHSQTQTHSHTCTCTCKTYTHTILYIYNLLYYNNLYVMMKPPFKTSDRDTMVGLICALCGLWFH